MSLHTKHIALLVALLAAALMVTGCAEDTISWVDEGATYSVPAAEDLARSLANDNLADTSVSDAPALRQEALADLRGFGTEASSVADLLTRVFVSDIRSVPFYVEAAQLDDVDVWLVVESWGPAEGTLESTRLWAFERATGDVVLATAVN